jgi:hypothetical protein
VNAIHCPSGENFPNNSTPGCEVKWSAVPPLEGAVHRSPPYVNTTRSPRMSGNLKSFVWEYVVMERVRMAARIKRLLVKRDLLKTVHRLRRLHRKICVICGWI